MPSRTLPAALLLCVTAPALTLLGPVVASPAVAAQEEPPADTTPPQIDLDPCFGSEPCQRHAAYVAGWLDEGDDLAVLGAAKGDEIEIRASGPAAEEALDLLVTLVEDRFGEE